MARGMTTTGCRSMLSPKLKLALSAMAVVALPACDMPLSHSDSAGLTTPLMSRQVNASSQERWSAMTEDELFEYVARTDSTVLVALKPPGAPRAVVNGVVALTMEQQAAVLEALLDHLPANSLRSRLPTIPVVRLHVSGPAAIRLLRSLPTVDFVEPALVAIASYDGIHDSSGCGSGSAWTGSLDSIGGDVLPWNFIKMQIDDAWDRSNGDGVRIAIIDTGVDQVQPELTWIIHAWHRAETVGHEEPMAHLRAPQ